MPDSHLCAAMAEKLVITTPLGAITLVLRRDVAPVTAAHVARLVSSKLFDGVASWYRADFVIQFGLHGTGVSAPPPPLTVNESSRPGRLSNKRGTLALAHWDVPDCGGSEAFISLKDNPHLDDAFGGFCVVAAVDAHDAASFAVIDAIARAVAGGAKTPVTSCAIVAA